MKKNIISYIFIAITVVIRGQVILDTNDLPAKGDMQISVVVDSVQGISLPPGNTGANVVWDFSTLEPCCSNLQNALDTVTWINHAATPNTNYFPRSNIARQEKCSTYHSHVTHVDELECSYNHYIKDTMGLWFYGIEDPENLTYDSYWNVFPLLQYGDTFQHVARIEIPVSVDTIRIFYTISTSVADAWGTLITPSMKEETIRILTTETVYDSIYVKNVGREMKVYSGNYYYKWYAKNLGFPVLEISKGKYSNKENNYTRKVKYAFLLSTSIADENSIVSKQNILVYPNPASTNITFYFEKQEKYILKIVDMLGNEINKVEITESKTYTMYRENLSNGMYFYEISDSNNQRYRGKFIIQ